jgi:hypothetical protein
VVWTRLVGWVGLNGLQPLPGLVRSGSFDSRIERRRPSSSPNPSPPGEPPLYSPSRQRPGRRALPVTATSTASPKSAPRLCPHRRRLIRRPRISCQVGPKVSNASLILPLSSYPTLPFFYHRPLVACLSRRQLARRAYCVSVILKIKKGSRTNVVYPSLNLGVYDASMFGRGSI